MIAKLIAVKRMSKNGGRRKVHAMNVIVGIVGIQIKHCPSRVGQKKIVGVFVVKPSSGKIKIVGSRGNSQEMSVIVKLNCRDKN